MRHSFEIGDDPTREDFSLVFVRFALAARVVAGDGASAAGRGSVIKRAAWAVGLELAVPEAGSRVGDPVLEPWRRTSSFKSVNACFRPIRDDDSYVHLAISRGIRRHLDRFAAPEW